MSKSRFKPIHLIWLLIPAFVLILLLPIKISHKIDITGKLIPTKEWYITKGTDGRIISQVRDHIKGNSQSFSVNLFERGDIITFKLSPRISAGFFININDTVGLIQSNEVRRNLIDLQGQLTAKRAELEMYRSGEKESLIEMARQNLITAQKKAEMQTQIAKRQKALYERNLISEEQYEIEQTKVIVMDAEVQLATARLNSLLEGAKEEQIYFIRTQIQAIEREMIVYKQRLAQSVILAPISGQTSNTFSSDTLLHVLDIQKLVLIFPLNLRDKKYVRPEQTIALSVPEIDVQVNARIMSIGNTVLNLNGRHNLIATALVENGEFNLSPGLMVKGKLSVGKVTPVEYLVRFFKTVLH